MKPALRPIENDIPREEYISSRLLECNIILFIFLLAIALQLSLYNVFLNGDLNGLKQWFEYIKDHGRFAAFNDTFSDYNLPYLYLFAFASYFPIDPAVAIKSISVVFNLGLALFTYLILWLKYQQSCVPILGAIVILFTPTAFINSAAWGQCDAIYTTWCLASLYCLLSKRPAWACVFFGLAISFKLQAIFFLPVLLILFLTRKIPLKCLTLISVVFLVLLVPAFLAGRDIWSLLNVYCQQAKEYSWVLVMKAPTIYQWIPGTDVTTLQASDYHIPSQDVGDWIQMGEILATAMVALISFLVVRSRKPITPGIVLKLTLIFAVAIPFFLPEIHERYFYLADVASIIYAFYFPCYFYLAIIEQLCSCMSVIPSLFGQNPTINLTYVTFALLFIIVIMMADLVKTLFPTTDGSAATPKAFGVD